jgi:hypothetical protein
MCNPRQVLACVCCSSGFTAEPAQLTLAVVAEPLNRESPIQPAASHPAAGSQPVERNHAHHPSGGCSTGFGAGSANRCACSRHASRSARSRAIASISVVATPRDASKQGGQDRLRTLSAAARSSSRRRSAAYSSRQRAGSSRRGQAAHPRRGKAHRRQHRQTARLLSGRPASCKNLPNDHQLVVRKHNCLARSCRSLDTGSARKPIHRGNGLVAAELCMDCPLGGPSGRGCGPPAWHAETACLGRCLGRAHV